MDTAKTYRVSRFYPRKILSGLLHGTATTKAMNLAEVVLSVEHQAYESRAGHQLGTCGFC